MPTRQYFIILFLLMQNLVHYSLHSNNEIKQLSIDSSNSKSKQDLELKYLYLSININNQFSDECAFYIIPNETKSKMDNNLKKYYYNSLELSWCNNMVIDNSHYNLLVSSILKLKKNSKYGNRLISIRIYNELGGLKKIEFNLDTIYPKLKKIFEDSIIDSSGLDRVINFISKTRC